MSFLRSLFSTKPQPDSMMVQFLEEITAMSEEMSTLRLQFAQYGRMIQLMSHTSMQLASNISRFNAKIQKNSLPPPQSSPQSPNGTTIQNSDTPPIYTHIHEFATNNTHFREDIHRAWSKQFVDEVVGMFEHWQKQAEAQQTTINNYHIAREHCFTLKEELQELWDKKQRYLSQKRPFPLELQQVLQKSEVEYKKYLNALESIRNAICANQSKLLGKNGQLISFSRAFYGLLESQCNFSQYFNALARSYEPLLESYRRELGIIYPHDHPHYKKMHEQLESTPNSSDTSQLQSNSTITSHTTTRRQSLASNTPASLTSHTPSGLLPPNPSQPSDPQQHPLAATMGGLAFSDEISVLDIAHFIRETANFGGDKDTISDVDDFITMYKVGIDSTQNDSLTDPASVLNDETPVAVQDLGLFVEKTIDAPKFDRDMDSPSILPRAGSINPLNTNQFINLHPGSPQQSPRPATFDKPSLSLSLSTRKKRQTTGGLLSSRGDSEEYSLAGVPVGNSNPAKKSSRASMAAVPFNLDDSHDIVDGPLNINAPGDHFHQNSNEIDKLQKNNTNNIQQNNDEDSDVLAELDDLMSVASHVRPTTISFLPTQNVSDQIDDGYYMDADLTANVATQRVVSDGTVQVVSQPLYRTIIEKMVGEDTILAAEVDNAGQIGSDHVAINDEIVDLLTQNISHMEALELALQWSNIPSSLAPSSQFGSAIEQINAIHERLVELADTYIADWVVVQIDLESWARSQSLQMLLCTLHTVQLCKDVERAQALPGFPPLTRTIETIDIDSHNQTTQRTIKTVPLLKRYGFVFRSMTPSSTLSVFNYVFTMFNGFLQQLLGSGASELSGYESIVNGIEELEDFFNNPNNITDQHKYAINVKRVVYAAELLHMLIIICNRVIEQNNKASFAQPTLQPVENDEDEDVEYVYEDEDDGNDDEEVSEVEEQYDDDDDDDVQIDDDDVNDQYDDDDVQIDRYDDDN